MSCAPFSQVLPDLQRHSLDFSSPSHPPMSINTTCHGLAIQRELALWPSTVHRPHSLLSCTHPSLPQLPISCYMLTFS